jgi:hypothetical protein
MTSICDPETAVAKVMLIGESGQGKTGAEAALICGGYTLRKADTDKGVKILRGLLTHPKYPYAKIIEERGIDLRKAIDFQPISEEMGFVDTVHRFVDERAGKVTNVNERILAPKSAKAWAKFSNLLENWPGAGHLETWDSNTVLSIDALDRAARYAYYHIQSLNHRLGAREDGYDFQRDTGAAQNQIRRLMEFLSNDSVVCNVVLITHIRRVDLSAGFAQSPDERNRQKLSTGNAKGYPAAIGQAISPHLPESFNDVYVVEDGQIHTVQTDKVAAKTSTWLEKHYPVSSGLYEIFQELRGEPVDAELVTAMRAHTGMPLRNDIQGLNLPS